MNTSVNGFDGAKLALISGGRILTMLRDDIPKIPFPNMWDLPGGGREVGETPEQCVLRELHEEFGVKISPTELIYSSVRKGVLKGQNTICFFGANMPDFDPDSVCFGNEGQCWKMMDVSEFLARENAITHQKEQVTGFLDYLKTNDYVEKENNN